MRKPYKCPVCCGKGIVSNSFYGSVENWSTISLDPEMCRTCSGGGIVWDEQDQFSWPIYFVPSVTIQAPFEPPFQTTWSGQRF